MDQNTFEDGAFKSIIERVREEGYILRPCFDSSYSTVADRSPNSSVYVEPYYPTPNFPPQFMYHLEDNGFMYRINVIYIDEAYIDAADEDGYMGYKNYRDGDTSGAWKKTEEYDRISHKTVRIDGKNRNVTFYTEPTQNTVTGYFVWEKYLIKVNGEIKSEDISEYAFCNTELLKHLSFKKLPLDQ